MQLSPGSLAWLDGRPVTILSQVGEQVYYIPGFHNWTCTYRDRFTAVDRKAPL